MAFTSEQAERLIERLSNMDAPEEVIAALRSRLLFEQEDGNLGDLEDILFQSCKKANWTKPWEKEGEALTFRAHLIGAEHPEHKFDVGGENTPAEEQAFRRGFSHGFAHAKELVSDFPSIFARLSSAEKTIREWRFEPIHERYSARWGAFNLANYELQISLKFKRVGLPSSMRYRILARDNYRCKICGKTADDGARLEVDHKISVRDGGTNSEENLRTLCFDCNRGKGATSEGD